MHKFSLDEQVGLPGKIINKYTEPMVGTDALDNAPRLDDAAEKNLLFLLASQPLRSDGKTSVLVEDKLYLVNGLYVLPPDKAIPFLETLQKNHPQETQPVVWMAGKPGKYLVYIGRNPEPRTKQPQTASPSSSR